MTNQNKERLSKLFMAFVSILGWVLFLYSVFHLEQPQDDISIYILLMVFLALSHYYPIPVWRGNASFSFPIVYALYFIFGMYHTVVLFAVIVLFISMLRQHPFRIICFNPAQLVISFYLAGQITEALIPYFFSDVQSVIGYGILHFFSILLIYYMVNNIIIDVVLLIRPQKYTFQNWKQKMQTETITATITFVYGCLFYILGNQDRGNIDSVAFFFFFSPLIGLSLLSSVIVRLRREKDRLKALFSITTELNQIFMTKDWLSNFKVKFHTLLDADASILWVKEDMGWVRGYEDGNINGGVKLSQEEMKLFENIKETLYFENTKKDSGVASACFPSNIKSLVYAPLIIKGETIGMLVVGRGRTMSFIKDDIQSIAILANQLVVILKNRMLFKEQERLLIVEERNRIAREIHDGVAQTLAGAIMKLETAERKYLNNKQETLPLLQDSIHKMRFILKEVRDSIYALRPNPTTAVTLSSAILQKIKTVQKEHELEISFDIRGEEKTLSSLVEKIMYETLQESLQNCIKHSKASKINVLLSYQSEHILLKVKDNGVGFSLFQAMITAQNQPHFGILSMNEAAEKINASLQIDSREGGGTEVILTVPKMGLEGEELHDQSDAG